MKELLRIKDFSVFYTDNHDTSELFNRDDFKYGEDKNRTANPLFSGAVLFFRCIRKYGYMKSDLHKYFM